MEKCSGSLFDHFRKKFDSVLPSHIDGFFQLADGLNSFHLQGKVHGDIKPENILISNENGKLKYKIGLTCVTSYEQYRKDHSPASPWKGGKQSELMNAPELLITNSNPTQSSDRFSLGIVLHQIITNGKHPFQGVKKEDGGEGLLDINLMNGVFKLEGDFFVVPFLFIFVDCFFCFQNPNQMMKNH